jgi:tetratricopeptide (TPR) repeat protein
MESSFLSEVSMIRYALAAVICVLGLAGLAGCASAPVAPTQLPWQDQAFEYSPALVTVGKNELLRVDPSLAELLGSPRVQEMNTPQRLKHLLALIFGEDRQRFAYAAGHSTTAAETWRNQRGDCLSLTVMTYSAARMLGMAVQTQEVRAPLLFDRRGGLDVVNRHVNVMFLRAHRDLRDAEARDVVVDFDPDFASRRPGNPLTEEGLLARYYNNVAAEHLGKGRRALAYAHFKAAIQADPTYAAPYVNLAVLYRDAGLAAPAEELLHRAIALADSADVPLHTLHQLLVEQGRTAEAQRFARKIEAGRERDPYHWIGIGLRHLNEGEIRRAIGALETAKELTSGFDEIHRYLALAYARNGEPAKARDELARVASMTGDARLVSKLKRKIRDMPQ